MRTTLLVAGLAAAGCSSTPLARSVVCGDVAGGCQCVASQGADFDSGSAEEGGDASSEASTGPACPSGTSEVAACN